MRTLDGIFNLLGAIVGLAALTVFFTSPTTSNVISTSGNAFATTIRAATGK